MKILFICRDRINGYGKSIGLINSANFVSNYINTTKNDSKVVTVIDGNCIDREVFTYKPNIVIIEAIWVTPDKIKELIKIHKNVQWFIRIHSKLSFLSNEGIAFDWLFQYSKIENEFKNFHLTANSKEMVADLNKIFNSKKFYTPNIYFPPEYSSKEPIKDISFINIACFGAIRPLKNQLIQAVSAIEYGNESGHKIKFHINAERIEMSGNNVYKNLKSLFDSQSSHKLMEHTWYDHEKFISVIKQMDLGLQVSYSETYNIVAADFVWNNIPLIGSPEINWLSQTFMVSPNSSHEIKEKIRYVIEHKTHKEIYNLNKKSLEQHNERYKKLWDEFIESI